MRYRREGDGKLTALLLGVAYVRAAAKADFWAQLA